MNGPLTLPITETHLVEREAIADALAPTWTVILCNDDVTPIDVPIEALISVIGLSQNEAIRRTLRAQAEGRCAVAATTFERAEFYHHELTERYGLTVTIERQS